MKKIFILILCSAICLGGCTMSNEESTVSSVSDEKSSESAEITESGITEESFAESNAVPDEISSESEITESSEEPSEESSEEPSEESKAPLTLPFISLEKSEFEIGEKIVVTYGNTDAKDWIGIYEPGGEPGGVNSLVWNYSVGSGKVTFSTKSLSSGEYGVFLCDNDGYVVLDSAVITIKSDDKNDYGVQNVTAHIEKGNSFVTVTPCASTDKDGKALTYVFYWSNGGKRLDGYEPLYTYSSQSDAEFTYTFNPNLFMPDAADGIEVAVKEGNSSSWFISCGNELKLEKSTLLYEFQVLTDLHITSGRPMHITHLRNALNDIATLSPNSKGIFTVGDNTNEGKDEQYELLLGILDEYKDRLPEIYFALGNHDLMYGTDYNVQVDKFKNYLGMPSAYYSVTLEGSKYIVLASDTLKGEGTMGDTEIKWLEKELESADKTKPIYVFVHQPLIDTVAGSLYSSNPKIQYWYGFASTGNRIKKLLESYDNLILFSGHTHWTFDSVQPILVTESGMTHVGCSSVGYLWNDSDKSEPGSEGYFIEVYKDYILLRGREFVNGTWCASAQYMLPISQ